MAKLTKRMQALRARLRPARSTPALDALNIVKSAATAKFDESIDVAIQLGIDPRKSDQAVRGAVVMPEGTGKTVRVAVFTQGANADAAREAGADIVGFDDLAAKVKAGELDFDVVIASPDAMRVVGQLGQILGPRGLMPNPRSARSRRTLLRPSRTPRPVRSSSAPTRLVSSTPRSAVLPSSRTPAEEPCCAHRAAQQAEARLRQGSVPPQGRCLLDDGPRRAC